MKMTEEQIAARAAEIDAMEARVMAASNKEDAISAEITRLMNERDEARAEAVAAREHTDRAVDEIRRTLPASLRLAAEEEREACAVICDEIEASCCAMQREHVVAGRLREASEAWEMAGVAEDCAEKIRARGAGGA